MDNTSAFDICEWLSTLGLSDYAQAFIDNDVDEGVLASLTPEDLRELGIQSVGHRRRILDAASRLDQQDTIDPVKKTEPHVSPDVLPVEQSAERRNLTVMFCDLLDSTTLAVNVDPEDLRDYFARYRSAIKQAVEPYAGYIAQYQGDGIMIYFGYPRSIEYDAENAVAAGLAILESITALEPLNGHRSQVRIGIATGLTVVGATDKDGNIIGDSAVGETPNLAARLQAIAEANTLVVAQSTRKRIGNLFECVDLGSFEMKGFESPVDAWRVKGHIGSISRFRALRSGERATSFVGRKQEMNELRHWLADSRAGNGQFAVIVGEGGVGKSRLARQFIKETTGTGEDLPILQCTPYNVGTAFHPIRYYIEQISGVTHSDSPKESIGKLSTIVARAGPVTPEGLALIAELVRINNADLTPLQGLTSQERRNRTMTLLGAIMHATARDSDAIILEDMQWIDPSTAELIERMLPSLRELSLLLVATMRPDPFPKWLNESKARFIRLERLDRSNIGQLIRAAANGVPIPDKVMDAIVNRSDGIPIFAEELTRGYAEAALEGRNIGDELERIPDSLADSLLARLDRLKIGRKLALTAAVIGNVFPIAVLVAISGLPEAKAREGVNELLEANVLFVKHSLFGESISFRHMLLREAAYQLLLKRDRIALHELVARKLVTEFPHIAESVPHIVAFHLEQAGDFRSAAIEWDRAGDQTAKRSAYAEAIGHLQKAIDANSRCDDSQERDERELSYRLSLSSALIASRGFSAEGVAEQMERAVLLSKKTGTIAKLVPAMTAKWIVQGTNNQMDACLELAEQIGELAKNGSDVDRLLAHRVKGTTLLFGGRFHAAMDELRAFFSIYDFDLHEDGLSVVGPSNHAIMMMIGWAEALTFTGKFEGAEQWQKKAFDAARKNGQIHHMCNVTLFAGCFVSALRDQNDALALHAQRLKTLSDEHDLPFWRSHAELFNGLSLIRRGDHEEGFSLARRGVKGLIASNAFNTCWYILYADACEKGGRYAEAAKYLAMVKPSQDQGDRWMAAEFHRIGGRLIWAQDGSANEAEASFQTALDIANEQGARLFVDRVKSDIEAMKARASLVI